MGTHPDVHPRRTSAALRGARNAPATTRLFRQRFENFVPIQRAAATRLGNLFPALTRRLRAGLTARRRFAAVPSAIQESCSIERPIPTAIKHLWAASRAA